MYASNCARYSCENRLPSLENVNAMPCLGPVSARTSSTKLGLPPFRLMTACSKFEDFEKNNTFFAGVEGSAALAGGRQTKYAIVAIKPSLPKIRIDIIESIKKRDAPETGGSTDTISQRKVIARAL